MILVIDLEATCWEDNEYKQKNEMEIIELGGAILNDNFDLVGSVSVFIKPILNPVLTDYCKNLTSIGQEDVNTAQEFPQALPVFLCAVKKHLGQSNTLKNIVWASWGKYDANQLKKDCQRHSVEYPFGYHWNIKEAFSKIRETKKRFGVAKALKKLELEFEGTPHRGVDDAINIARIIKKQFMNENYKQFVEEEKIS